MISDVLSDAVCAIEECEADGGYEDLVAELTVVKTIMDAMRIYVDSFGSQNWDKHGAALLAAAIRKCDVSGVKKAQEELLAAMRAAAEKK